MYLGNNYMCDWLCKISNACTQTEIDFTISQLTATLNNQLCTYAHSLHWLMSTNLLSRVLLANHANSQLVKWCQWRALNWQLGPDITLTVSIILYNYVYLGFVVKCCS